ncbi:MAG: hypothetical protein L6Q35_14950 [Phycisphaerales bacterium]|nr:hypothetical protein [Phycisphaerales bacterium]
MAFSTDEFGFWIRVRESLEPIAPAAQAGKGVTMIGARTESPSVIYLRQ